MANILFCNFLKNIPDGKIFPGSDATLLPRFFSLWGRYPLKQTEIVNAENVNKETLHDHSFNVMNLHGALSVGGALLVVAVPILACLWYGMARYRDYVERMRHGAPITLEIIKPSCLA